MTSVSIPASITNIGSLAFMRCANLAAINIDTNNSIYSSLNGVLFDKGQATLIAFPGGISGHYTVPIGVSSIGPYAFAACGVTNVTIPGSVTTIGDDAFWHSFNLSSVTLSNGVASIGNQAFYFCGDLASVSIPASVTNIGSSAFLYCTNLAAIYVDTNNSIYSSLDGVLFDKGQATLISFPCGVAGYYTVPSGVRSIGTNAFYHCSGLTDVAIPESVASIGADAFSGCYGLTEVTIPESVVSIGPDAFSECSQLTNITIRGRASSVGANAFSSCPRLTSVTISGSVSSIGTGAFSDCYDLTNVFFQGNAPTPTDDSSVFASDGRLSAVHYLPGTTGWGTDFDGVPTALWFLPTPLILNDAPGFGVQSNMFGFTVSWATNISVVVEACTDLANPLWFPVTTNSLSNGSFYFSELLQTQGAGRFYRIRSP
jgi:hypothetical protein